MQRLLFIWLSVFLLSCNLYKQDKTADSEGKSHVPVNDAISTKALIAMKQAEKLLKNAALVTRSDNDFESLTLQNFSKREQAYSHSGLAFLEEGKYVVYHSMAGHENPDGLLRRDPFDSFVNPFAKTGFGIFQYQLSPKEITALHNIVKEYFNDKVPFDLTFNLKSDDSMYCSEMIYKGLKAATNDRVVLPISYINNFTPKIMGYKHNSLFFKKFEYIGIDDLYLNPFCKEVIRVKY